MSANDPTSEPHIDRLVLNVPAMPIADARHLGSLVASGLARAAGSVARAPGMESLLIKIDAEPTIAKQALADRIVADALRQIRRTP